MRYTSDGALTVLSYCMYHSEVRQLTIDSVLTFVVCTRVR